MFGMASRSMGHSIVPVGAGGGAKMQWPCALAFTAATMRENVLPENPIVSRLTSSSATQPAAASPGPQKDRGSPGAPSSAAAAAAPVAARQPQVDVQDEDGTVTVTITVSRN